MSPREIKPNATAPRAAAASTQAAGGIRLEMNVESREGNVPELTDSILQVAGDDRIVAFPAFRVKMVETEQAFASVQFLLR
jgi:hypothetical protein